MENRHLNSFNLLHSMQVIPVWLEFGFVSSGSSGVHVSFHSCCCSTNLLKILISLKLYINLIQVGLQHGRIGAGKAS